MPKILLFHVTEPKIKCLVLSRNPHSDPLKNEHVSMSQLEGITQSQIPEMDMKLTNEVLKYKRPALVFTIQEN